MFTELPDVICCGFLLSGAQRHAMYSLLHGFYQYMVQKDEFCVLILGLDNAGKTVSPGGPLGLCALTPA